jgi:hypothetical protein
MDGSGGGGIEAEFRYILQTGLRLRQNGEKRGSLSREEEREREIERDREREREREIEREK